MSNPQYGERSPDGHYWWDGTAWQSVDQGSGQAAATAGETPAGQAGAGATGGPAVLAKVDDPSELHGHFDNAMEAAEGHATELQA